MFDEFRIRPTPPNIFFVINKFLFSYPEYCRLRAITEKIGIIKNTFSNQSSVFILLVFTVRSVI